jgi:hypothetical protein
MEKKKLIKKYIYIKKKIYIYIYIYRKNVNVKHDLNEYTRHKSLTLSDVVTHP